VNLLQESRYLKQLSTELVKEYNEKVALIDSGAGEEAVEFLERLLEEHPNFVPAYNKLAVIAINSGQPQAGEDYLYQALEIDSDFAPALTNLGSLAFQHDQVEKAKKYYEKAIACEPEYGPAYNNLGVIYREEGKITESVKYLKKARKYGSYAVKFGSGRKFYQEPGCVFAIIIFIVAILIFYFWLT